MHPLNCRVCWNMRRLKSPTSCYAQHYDLLFSSRTMERSNEHVHVTTNIPQKDSKLRPGLLCPASNAIRSAKPPKLDMESHVTKLLVKMLQCGPCGWGWFEFQAGREIIATSRILRRERDTGRHKERPRKLVFCALAKGWDNFGKHNTSQRRCFIMLRSSPLFANPINFRHFIGFRRMWNEFIEVRTSSSESVLVNLNCLTTHRIQPQRQHWPRPPWHSKFQNKIIYNLRSVKACLRQCILTPCNWGANSSWFLFSRCWGKDLPEKKDTLGPWDPEIQLLVSQWSAESENRHWKALTGFAPEIFTDSKIELESTCNVVARAKWLKHASHTFRGSTTSQLHRCWKARIAASEITKNEGVQCSSRTMLSSIHWSLNKFLGSKHIFVFWQGLG